MKRRLLLLMPLAIFLLLLVFFYDGLKLDPSLVSSPLIGKPAPQFALTELYDPSVTISNADMKGEVWLLNVWASWCVSCRAEHPVLVDLARQRVVPVYGLNYKDQREDAIGWLKAFGNPYVSSLHDLDGRVGMDYGVYGVPETYVIDRQGIIRYKQIGPVTAKVLNENILPLVQQLKEERPS
ncbi:MAG: DsbE family thiol:disulfide interchange protein [Chromatiales bacterium]|jgi:cytochrome c biogenesis protein CcmG/thiol:disulfide interchange protein DsbE|nr:DsbE family thiol:disulfide interchange protein [Chromatiales bacterium]